MAGRKLLQRLLRMKGFRITWFELYVCKYRFGNAGYSRIYNIAV
jgi:hypothetical protein